MTDEIMPPPYKVMRRGTQELDDAIRNGYVQLSLPHEEWSSWITPSDDQQWQDYETCQPGESTGSRTVRNVYSQHGESSPVPYEDDEHQSTNDTIRSSEQPHDQSPSPVKASVEKQEVGKSSESSIDRSLPRFSDIIGHSAVKLRLDEVLLPLALPSELADTILVGVRSLSASILLFGPPGCGKTQLAKAIAGQAEAAFLSVGPSDIMSKFVGESEAAIRSVFDQAYEQARKVESKCTVLFFDEIDALGQSRGGGPHHHHSSPTTDPGSRRVLAELLIQLNRISTKHGGDNPCATSSDDSASVSSMEQPTTGIYHRDDASCTSEPSRSSSRVRLIVVAATNRPEDCDAALLRRFAVRVMVNLPTRRDRKKILMRYLKGIQHSISSEHLDSLALETQGWTGSDLESLTREAAMAPIRECIRAAALMKRRNRRLGQPPIQEQCGGSSTSQQDSTKSTEKQLLEQFSSLRPVTVGDFMNAIAFWAYNHGTGDVMPLDEVEKPTLNGQTIHYDSSSDEED